jgi:hypothetical protein
MTVARIGDDLGTLTAWCIWHDGKKKMEGTFPVVSLEKVEKPQSPAKSGWAAIRKTRFRPPGAC